MSNISNLEQQIANLQINHGDGIKTIKSGKKVGPAVPPKPKKSQPQVPQSYTIKAASVPSYSTVLNNSGQNEKPSNLYVNSPSPYVLLNMEKNDFSSTNGKDISKNYQNNENFYIHQSNEKFEPKYGYDEKNHYSNISNMPAPQVPIEDHSRSTRNIVYSNIDPPISIPINKTTKTEKDIIYSNIQWNSKPENTYCNISSAHNNDDLPPPPEPSEYVPCVPGSSFPPPPEELPPPPSPVSSSYSELRRATYQTDFPSDNYPNDIYGPSSQSSSTYESIYEPINPRPPSQLSCNYSMYSGYGSATSTQPQGKVSPYCEEDYLNTLEKCCVCTRPILDRILRATGKPYHPSCFTCVVCGQSLDGIPFTVDATNQIHCIQCFHKKFAPRCCVCKLPIMPEPGQDETVRVVALDRSFHIQCYKCEDCGLILSSDSEGRGCYPLDDHVLCKSCNATRVQALTSHMTTEL